MVQHHDNHNCRNGYCIVQKRQHLIGLYALSRRPNIEITVIAQNLKPCYSSDRRHAEHQQLSLGHLCLLVGICLNNTYVRYCCQDTFCRQMNANHTYIQSKPQVQMRRHELCLFCITVYIIVQNLCHRKDKPVQREKSDSKKYFLRIVLSVNPAQDTKPGRKCNAIDQVIIHTNCKNIKYKHDPKIYCASTVYAPLILQKRLCKPGIKKSRNCHLSNCRQMGHDCPLQFIVHLLLFLSCGYSADSIRRNPDNSVLP